MLALPHRTHAFLYVTSQRQLSSLGRGHNLTLLWACKLQCASKTTRHTRPEPGPGTTHHTQTALVATRMVSGYWGHDMDRVSVQETPEVSAPSTAPAHPGGLQPRTLLVVGPEGDFTEAEQAALVAAGGRLVGLGPLRLRSETAAVALLSAAMLHCSRTGGAGSPGDSGS